MLVALQLVGVAAVPLNVTVLDPCEAPKLYPRMVIDVPTGPDDGERLLMLGEVTVKFEPLLASPETKTVTLPLAAPTGTGTTMLVELQLVGVAAVPLKETVLDPCVEPKFVPVIVTEAPDAPDVGDKVVIPGGMIAEPRLKNVDGLLWLLYSVAIQSADRIVFETRASVSNPPPALPPNPPITKGSVVSAVVELVVVVPY
jgi:hypothetical protein